MGSTLRRSSLTRENMGLLASLSQTGRRQTTRSQLNQCYKTGKNHELDILWGGVQKGIQKVHSATKGPQHKSPAAYLTIGFIAGVLFMSCITFIVSISTMTPKTVSKINNANANSAIVGEDGLNEHSSQLPVMQEKYIVKKGDTLNGIAYRYYGKYDPARIAEIRKINHITNPEAISIGQELIIPVMQDR